MMKTKWLFNVLASLALTGCVTYTSEYANDGYYSSPRDSYSDYGDDYYGNPDSNDGYDGDGYYGNTGNYGQYSYGSGGYSSISFTFNFGSSYSRYRYYPSYYGYHQCSPWSAYCYGGYNSGYGWSYPPYYGYYPHHPRPPHQHPKPKPPKNHPDHPKQNPGQPGFHPGYPIVDRADGPRPRQQQYRPINTAPQQQGQTQPIANGGTPNTPQYPRQQPRPRPITLPIADGKERERYTERERYVERETMPRQQQNYPQRPQPRARPVQSEQQNNDYTRFSQTPRNAPVQQNQTPRNRPPNNQQHVNAVAVVAQQIPQQRVQAQPKPERRERAESKPREPKAERQRDGDEP